MTEHDSLTAKSSLLLLNSFGFDFFPFSLFPLPYFPPLDIPSHLWGLFVKVREGPLESIRQTTTGQKVMTKVRRCFGILPSSLADNFALQRESRYALILDEMGSIVILFILFFRFSFRFSKKGFQFTVV
jgi:hypothetical protein